MAWLNRFLASFRTERLERELDDEMAFHVEMKARDLAAAGLDGEEAERQARLRFGNATVLRERTRDRDVLLWVDELWRDVRFSVRSLARSRMYTAVVVLTLALGLGANVAVFSLVHSVLIRPLPFPDSRNLMFLMSVDENGQDDWLSYADLLDFRRQSKTLDGIAAFTAQSVNLTGERAPERLSGRFVSSPYFELLGARPELGRLLQMRDDEPGSERVTVLTHELWKNRYGGDPGIVGRKLVLNNELFTVVGVAASDSELPWWGACDLYLPFIYYPNYKPGARTQNTAGLAHVRPGASHQQAQEELSALAKRLAGQYPDSNRGRGVRMVTFQEFLVRELRPTLRLLWGAVGFVFVIACANIANLALSRVLSRTRELGIRSALGAGRLRLVRQILAEQLLLSLCGAGIGLVLGAWGADLLAAAKAADLAGAMRIEVSPAVVAMCFGLAVAAGMMCGLLPAMHVLREGGTRRRERGVTRRALVVAEVAVALVLLAGAGLLLKSFARVSGIDPGFRTHNRLTLEYRVPRNKYPEPAQQWAFHAAAIQRIRELPGVRSASAMLALPFSGNYGGTSFILPDRPEPPRGSEPQALTNRTAPGLFETLGIPLLRGRTFDERDRDGAPPVALISRTFAERYWPGRDPIGRQIRLPEADNRVVTVLGVVGDIRHRNLTDDQQVQIWFAFAQFPHIFSTLVVETHGDPLKQAEAVRGAVWSVDKDQPVWKVRTLESLVDAWLSWRGFFPRLVSGFAAFGLLLAALGIYGVVAYSTGRRTREFGVRIACGARPADVLGMVLLDGLRTTAAGLAIGIAGALALARLLEKYLYEVKPSDPATLVTVAVVLAMVAALASFIPARRALRADPVTSLRQE
jgi:putative ABC transport system permease protein